MKKIFENSITLLNLSLIIVAFIIVINRGCSNPGTPCDTEEHEQEIQEQLGQIESLYDSLDMKQFTIDSLRKERNRIDTVWKIKISGLKQLSFSGQYEVLKENLDTSCHMILGKKLYFYEGDTLLGLNQPELLCINESFYQRFYCEEGYAAVMDELMETNNMVEILRTISSRKDMVINNQDSVITFQKQSIENLSRNNKHLRWGIIGTGAALILTLIVK
jgi:hypothetical protein